MPEPTPAATVIVLRDAPGGIEALMLRRNPEGVFGGMWVFPGGKVEPEDGDPHDEMATARNAAIREAREEAGIEIDPSTVVVTAHWLPPAAVPRRFSTWFFVGRATGEVVVDGDEIHDHGWLRPVDAIARHAAGELDLAPPTWVTLHHLAEQPDVASALAAAAAETPRRYHTRPLRRGDLTTLMWEGDVAYEGGDPDEPGPRHRLVMADRSWRYERS